MYAGEWPLKSFGKHGITYTYARKRKSQAYKTKSEIYQDFLPLITSNQCELLDNERLVNQLCSLERRTGRAGKDTIDHPPRSHDDLANAVAGSLDCLDAKPARSLRPEHSKAKVASKSMFPRAVTVRTYDRVSGEIIKIK